MIRPLQPGRIRCCIMGCGRTFKMDPGDTEDTTVMCGGHWRLADKRLRDLVTKIRRKARRVGWSPELELQHNRIWQKAADQAQERALGI